MTIISLYIVFIIIYLLIWIAVITGVVLIRAEKSNAIKIRKWIINKRMLQFKYPPFKTLLKFWIQKKYFSTSLFFLIIIISAACMYFAVGLLLLTPIISIYQGLIAGILIGGYYKKDLLWALTIGLFEFGYWALSGALGLSIIASYLFTDLSIASSFQIHFYEFSSGYWILLIACMIINAFGEIAGPIYLNVEGPISLEALAEGKEIK